MNKTQNTVTGTVTEIKRYAVFDGPGIRTTVFVKGCPLRCRWCSSPETWSPQPQIYFKLEKCQECGNCKDVCPSESIEMKKEYRISREKCTLCMECVDVCKTKALSIIGEKFTAEEIFDDIKKDKIFFEKSGGGLTISGGEPLSRPDFVSKIFKLCRENDIHTTLDTSGYGSKKSVEKILSHADLVLLDIKHMDPEKHREYTGVSNEKILENAELMANKTQLRISLPLIKDFNDSKENIEKTADFATSIGVEHIDLEPLHKLGEEKYRMLGMESPYPDFEESSDQEVKKVLEIIKSEGLKTTENRTM